MSTGVGGGVTSTIPNSGAGLLELTEKEAAALALANSKRNEIKEIRNYKQLEKVDLDFDSPRLNLALYNLGVSKEECMKK